LVPFKNISNSEKTILFLGIIIVSIRLCLPFENVLTWDVFGYYLYLPAGFIYHDLGLRDLTWVHRIMDSYDPSTTLYQVNLLPDGHGTMRYPCGEALLNCPFFLFAHLWARLFHFPTDGFSAPYNFFYAIGGVFYSILGLYFLRKILIQFFNEKNVTLVLFFIVAGTNYFEQATLQNTLTHNFLFTMYAVLIYNTIQWHLKFKNQNALFAGLAVGLITCIRANEIICVLIPIIWNVWNSSSIRNKIRVLSHNKTSLLLFFGGGLFAVLPQLIYWKLYAGHWFYYSYDDPGVGFEFSSPYIFNFLFSFRKGWFIYTPLMIVSVVGFYHLYIKNRPVFWPIFIYSILNLYIVSSWSCWWYAGGSFSSRSMVSSYPLLAIPFGYFLIQNHKKWILCLLGLIVALNIFQTWQSHKRILSNDRMTAAYYFKIFGKLSASESDKKLLLAIRPEVTIQDRPDTLLYKKSTLKTAFLINMDSGKIFTPPFQLPYNILTHSEFAWIAVSAEVSIPPENTEGVVPLIVINFTNKYGETYFYRTSEKEKLTTILKGDKTIIHMNYITPEVRNETDIMNVYLWYRGKQPVVVNNLVIDKYEPKND
jgi:hypothetical protein